MLLSYQSVNTSVSYSGKTFSHAAYSKVSLCCLRVSSETALTVHLILTN